jgi:hypothetical protein
VRSGFLNSIPGPSVRAGSMPPNQRSIRKTSLPTVWRFSCRRCASGCFRKGKYTTNSRLQPTALHSFECRSSAAEDFFARVDEISEAAAGNSNRFGHQRGGKDRIRRATRPAVKGDVASSGNRVKISCECALANSIDDVVGALAVRQPFRLGGEIFPGVKNHMVGACLASSLGPSLRSRLCQSRERPDALTIGRERDPCPRLRHGREPSRPA